MKYRVTIYRTYRHETEIEATSESDANKKIEALNKTLSNDNFYRETTWETQRAKSHINGCKCGKCLETCYIHLPNNENCNCFQCNPFYNVDFPTYEPATRMEVKQ